MRTPKPIGEVVVRYSAGEMPTETLERLQRENCDALVSDEVEPIAAFRVANLLLSIALMKLAEVAR